MKHFIKLYNYFLTKEYVHLYRECCRLKTLAQKEAELERQNSNYEMSMIQRGRSYAFDELAKMIKDEIDNLKH